MNGKGPRGYLRRNQGSTVDFDWFTERGDQRWGFVGGGWMKHCRFWPIRGRWPCRWGNMEPWRERESQGVHRYGSTRWIWKPNPTQFNYSNFLLIQVQPDLTQRNLTCLVQIAYLLIPNSKPNHLTHTTYFYFFKKKISTRKWMTWFRVSPYQKPSPHPSIVSDSAATLSSSPYLSLIIVSIVAAPSLHHRERAMSSNLRHFLLPKQSRASSLSSSETTI